MKGLGSEAAKSGGHSQRNKGGLALPAGPVRGSEKQTRRRRRRRLFLRQDKGPTFGASRFSAHSRLLVRTRSALERPSMLAAASHIGQSRADQPGFVRI